MSVQVFWPQGACGEMQLGGYGSTPLFELVVYKLYPSSTVAGSTPGLAFSHLIATDLQSVQVYLTGS